MAACGSLQHIFDKPLPETPKSLFDSLSSWKHVNAMKSLDHDIDTSSFTEIFGELHFKENPESVSSSPPSFSSSSSSSSSLLSSSVLTDLIPPPSMISNNQKPQETNYFPTNQTKHYHHSNSFSSMNSESLSMCTEGLGFESFYDVEDLKNNVESISTEWKHHHERRPSISFTTKHMQQDYLSGEPKRSRISGVEFPPPISSIGRNGKPGVCFKSYRNNGRFILKEVRIPIQEFLHASREDGRLKMQFIQSDDETFEDDVENEEEEEDRENGENGDDNEGIEGDHAYSDEVEEEDNGDEER